MSDKPKRPMSAYLMWLNSARQKIKADFPGLKVTEVAKKGGEIWRSMEDKSEWEAKAAKAKEQYTRDLESFNASGGAADGDEAPPKKALKRGKKGRQAAPKKKAREDASDDDEDEDEHSD